MESLVHDKSNQRKTFAEHCRKVYVLGTSFEHYRAWKFWMLNTRATRVSATVFHKHKYISNPNVAPANAVIAAAGNLASALKGTIPACFKKYRLADLKRLSEIFSEAEASPFSPLTTPNPIVDLMHKPFSQQISIKVKKTATWRLGRAFPNEHLISRQLKYRLFL